MIAPMTAMMPFVTDPTIFIIPVGVPINDASTQAPHRKIIPTIRPIIIRIPPTALLLPDPKYAVIIPAIMIATANGQACRFNEEETRPMGRVTRGVIGIRLNKDDSVVSMAIVGEEGNLLTITENGYGKRSPINKYRKTHRGSKVVMTIITNERNGKVIYVREASDDDEVMLTSKDGMMVRVPVKGIRIQGRNTMGVRIMRLNEDDKVVSVAKIVDEEYEESTEE